MKLAARLAVAFALITSIGAQWALLQGVAWVGMAVSYTLEEGSVSEGLEKTFDGDHPCSLCKAVQQGAQQENDPTAPLPKGEAKLKVEICQARRAPLVAPSFQRLPVETSALRADKRSFPPEGHPPESAPFC